MPLLILLLLEIIVFVLVGEWVGFLWATLLIILGSAFGLILLRSNQAMMGKRLQEKMRKGEMPLKEMMSMPFRLFAAVLLVIPGFLTDVLAILCLVPWTRNRMLNLLMNSKMVKNMQKNGMSGVNIDQFKMKMNTDMHQKHQKPANDTQKGPEGPAPLEGECWEDKDSKSPKDPDKSKD